MSQTLTELVPMTDADFDTYAAAAIADYAAEKAASGEWTQDAALTQARAEFDTLLPQGVHSQGHHLYTIRNTADAQTPIGALWFAVQQRGGRPVAFVYDIHIHPDYQRQGHATRAFQALEDRAIALGLSGIALHVFGHNTGAQALYNALGYHPTDIQMFKPLRIG